MTNYCDCLPCLNDAEVEVVLVDGDCYEVCKDHVELIIRTKATTENPVHEMNDYSQDDCGECAGTGKLTRLGGDWGKTAEAQVPCWRCKGTGRAEQ